MSDFNSRLNRVVWVDLPVADLERARKFYAAVLANDVQLESFGETKFAVLDHHDGNGGCLVLSPNEIAAGRGPLVYFNANGRIRDAVAQVERFGGKVIEPLRSMGPHGYRAVVEDSEGNRIALHSHSDA